MVMNLLLPKHHPIRVIHRWRCLLRCSICFCRPPTGWTYRADRILFLRPKKRQPRRLITAFHSPPWIYLASVPMEAKIWEVVVVVVAAPNNAVQILPLSCWEITGQPLMKAVRTSFQKELSPVQSERVRPVDSVETVAIPPTSPPLHHPFAVLRLDPYSIGCPRPITIEPPLLRRRRLLLPHPRGKAARHGRILRRTCPILPMIIAWPSHPFAVKSVAQFLPRYHRRSIIIARRRHRRRHDHFLVANHPRPCHEVEPFRCHRGGGVKKDHTINSSSKYNNTTRRPRPL